MRQGIFEVECDNVEDVLSVLEEGQVGGSVQKSADTQEVTRHHGDIIGRPATWC